MIIRIIAVPAKIFPKSAAYVSLTFDFLVVLAPAIRVCACSTAFGTPNHGTCRLGINSHNGNHEYHRRYQNAEKHTTHLEKARLQRGDGARFFLFAQPDRGSAAYGCKRDWKRNQHEQGGFCPNDGKFTIKRA